MYDKKEEENAHLEFGEGLMLPNLNVHNWFYYFPLWS